VYQNQYRAMFVMNCMVDQTEKLHLARNERQTAGRRKRRRSAADDGCAGDVGAFRRAIEPVDSVAVKDSDATNVYNAVRCQRCNTQVGMYDSDEVYHFFNIIASHT